MDVTSELLCTPNPRIHFVLCFWPAIDIFALTAIPIPTSFETFVRHDGLFLLQPGAGDDSTGRVGHGVPYLVVRAPKDHGPNGMESQSG